jgi:hypothetical protein
MPLFTSPLRANDNSSNKEHFHTAREARNRAEDGQKSPQSREKRVFGHFLGKFRIFLAFSALSAEFRARIRPANDDHERKASDAI